MKCPKCSYPNPQGVTYCNMCYEVFNRSAADRYLHAQKRARMNQPGAEATPSPDRSANEPKGAYTPVTRIIDEYFPNVDWKELLQQKWAHLKIVLQTYHKELSLAAGIIALSVLALFFTSSSARLKIFGKRLTYHFSTDASVGYLVGFHTELKSWSERAGRLDTPLDTFQKDETGNIDLIASNVQRNTQNVRIQPREWIINQTAEVSQTVPLSHPSLKPFHVILDRRGTLLHRDATFSTRTGRALTFLMPQWPAESKRSGDQWEEPLSWVETLGDWKIYWKGRLHWKVLGFENYEAVPCVHLTYFAEVTPSLWDRPSWAIGMTHNLVFRGTGSGEAYFDTRSRQLLSNMFFQEGTLTLSIDNIYRIPPELRIGRTPRHRLYQNVIAEAGTIVLQIKDKLIAHKS